jgi:hypothetical protein
VSPFILSSGLAWMMNYMTTFFIRFVSGPLHFFPPSSLTSFFNYNLSCGHSVFLWIYGICHTLSLLSLRPSGCDCLKHPSVNLNNACQFSCLHLYTSFKKHILISRLLWISLFSIPIHVPNYSNQILFLFSYVSVLTSCFLLKCKLWQDRTVFTKVSLVLCKC